MELPTIIVNCSQGHKWLVIAPPWEAGWDTEHMNCPSCNSKPYGWKWGGMRVLGKSYEDEKEFVARKPYDKDNI